MRSLEKFYQSRPAGFDGFWGWEEVEQSFPGKVLPTDIDGLVERKGNFLLFETKGVSESGTLKPIPTGQLITLKALHRLGCFTIAVIWCRETQVRVTEASMTVKEAPVFLKLWVPFESSPRPIRPITMVDVSTLCKKWFTYADTRPFERIAV